MPAHTLVLAAAREGLGLAIQPDGMVRRDLEAGSLVALYGPVRTGPGGYHLLTRPDQVSPRRDAFAAWLRRTAREEAGAWAERALERAQNPDQRVSAQPIDPTGVSARSRSVQPIGAR